jgi:hypothetical protein
MLAQFMPPSWEPPPVPKRPVNKNHDSMFAQNEIRLPGKIARLSFGL